MDNNTHELMVHLTIEGRDFYGTRDEANEEIIGYIGRQMLAVAQNMADEGYTREQINKALKLLTPNWQAWHQAMQRQWVQEAVSLTSEPAVH